MLSRNMGVGETSLTIMRSPLTLGLSLFFEFKVSPGKFIMDVTGEVLKA
jgi:hypothetical protein